jgi:hypothetical protein
MSQRNRRVLAALGLLAVLLLAVPAPAQAVGLWDERAAISVVARIWSWLEGRGLPGRASEPAPHRPEKSGTMNDPNGAPIPPPPDDEPTVTAPSVPNGEQ